MELLNYFLLVFAGFFAGFINTLAGSGSLITLPLLMFLGLSAHDANGTNRIGILVQSLVAVRNFKKDKTFVASHETNLVIPTVLGAIVGALIAISISEKYMRLAIGLLLVFMFFVVLLKPEKWLKEKSLIGKAASTPLRIVTFFGIGLYGGFIQAGVGLFMLAGMVLGAGYHLIRANAAKSLITLYLTIVALIIFFYSGQVNLIYGLVLSIGNGIGAYVASKNASRIGTKYIWYLLLTTTLIAGLKVLGVLSWLIDLM